ncbi:MerR family transcriptional regulator [Modestobacter sp. VKM Ac-2983]|uniref:MerR family transcriptional regulator n=1 Tax=Modestobacter sp. VKM Ac-2983 TaxID=3004137 RepID=UPI0022AB844D|nr:MerR family transcriptional regulator [Modestobacter sp. VKM Ac-2983]MCZ2805741.1 MerR family transcriptional regulator [Modestobacter sp. VKM Ac-2983]
MSDSSLGDSDLPTAPALRIGQLSQATGASPRSLRYYEQKGLLHSSRDPHGRGHRRYDDDAVTTVTHIRALLAAGVPTTLIYELLPCVQGPGPQLQQCAEPILEEQMRRVREQIVALRHAEGRLQAVICASRS